MKRILALILMFGVGSAANAVDVVDIQISSYGHSGQGNDPFQIETTPITPTDQYWLYPSEWVNLDIIYIDDGTGVGLISLALDIIVTGPATLYLGELGPASDNTLLTFPPGGMWDLINMPPLQPPISFIGPFDDGTYSTVANVDLAMSAGLIGVPGMPVVGLDHILLHCDDIGLVTVQVVNNPGANAGGTYNMAMATPGFGPGVTIIIPEPMTIALLGLGGLTLLRKRRR